MITEHTQWSAVPVGGWERITGNLLHSPRKTFICTNYTEDEGGFCLWEQIEVDPTTIEPVRVKPVKVYDDYMKQDRYKCPNCRRYIRIDDNYCQWKDCGQALDWSNT